MISTQLAKEQALVFTALKTTLGRYISLDNLKSASGLDNTAILNAIKYFRESGIEIFENGKEYGLLSQPDIILPATLLSGLKTRRIGKEIHCYKTIGSTNETAKRLAESGATEGTIVISEKQTRGRGRLGRSWHSPSGQGLYFSLVLRPELDFSRFPALSMVAALSVCRSLEGYGDLRAQVKWPNDCLLNGKKVAGILVELSAELDKVCYAILGVGINVNNDSSDFPPRLKAKATSLAIELGQEVDRADLLRKVLHNFEKSYNNFQRYGLRSIAPELIKRSAILGKKITVRAGHKRFFGEAMGFDNKGALRLKTKEGVKILSAGEVSLR